MIQSGEFSSYRSTVRKHQSRPRYLWKVSWGICVVLVGMFTLHRTFGSVAAAAAKDVNYTVVAGDTVWGIASRFDRHRDPRSLVDLIEQINHLDGTDAIRVGQVLAIPQG